MFKIFVDLSVRSIAQILDIAMQSTAVTAPPAPTTSFEPTVIGIGIAMLVVAVLGTAVIWKKKKEKKKIEK